jgi:hypothetical protein
MKKYCYGNSFVCDMEEIFKPLVNKKGWKFINRSFENVCLRKNDIEICEILIEQSKNAIDISVPLLYDNYYEREKYNFHKRFYNKQGFLDYIKKYVDYIALNNI